MTAAGGSDQRGEGAGEADVAGDAALLGRMGYAQELRRRMGAFSNFAIAFSTICILAGGITCGVRRRFPGPPGVEKGQAGTPSPPR